MKMLWWEELVLVMVPSPHSEELIHLSSRASCHLGSQITAAVGSERRVMR
jgi:hypothetical protein